MYDVLEDEKRGSFDIRLFKRLLAFVKPYFKLFLISFVMILVINFIEIYQPVIIKNSIDNYINSYSNDFVKVINISLEDKKLVAQKIMSFEIKGTLYVNKADLKNLEKEEGKVFEQEKEPLFTISHSEYTNFGNRINEILKKYPDIFYEIKEDTLYFKKGTILIPDSVIKNLSHEEIKVLRSGDISGIKLLSFLFLLLIASAFTISYLNTLLLQYLGQKIVYDIRVSLFKHISRLPFSFFNENPSGRITTRVTNDTEALQEMYSSALVSVLKDVFLILGLVIFMMILNIQLALILVSVFGVIIILTSIFRIFLREAHRRSRTILSRINAFIAERLQGIKVIQLFTIEDKTVKRFKKINDDYLKARFKQMMLNGFFRPMINALSSFSIALLLYRGGFDILKNAKLSFGILFIFIYYAQLFFRPIQEIAEKFDIFQSAFASSEKIFSVFDEKEENYLDKVHKKNIHLPLDYKNLNSEVEFKSVWFSYKKGEYVLKDVSFKVNEGESVAIVGPTGAGKTSITGLIPRFFEATKGEVLVGDINVKDIPLQVLRRKIAFVMQDVFLFAGTLTENIKLFEEKKEIEKINQISEYLNMKFINNLKDGFEQSLYERGVNLSAGERQLISFARALYFSPDIIILDEATSNIDSQSESIIQEALKHLLKGKTSLIVAHRLSTIRSADRILVIKSGRLIEEGNHYELIKKSGFYKELYELQTLEETV